MAKHTCPKPFPWAVLIVSGALAFLFTKKKRKRTT